MKSPTLPRHVFHLVEAVNWPSVQRRGLLSTQRLLEGVAMPKIMGSDVDTKVATHRSGSVVLADGTLIRDQAPMPPAALARCLIGGMKPGDWYALLNSWVFFWCDRARLERQARACAPRPQIVLTVDTEPLLARHGQRAALTPFNTGFARRKPAPRGRDSFVPYAAWRETGWASEAAARGGRTRPRGHAPVELVVANAVPDILDFVVTAQTLSA